MVPTWCGWGVLWLVVAQQTIRCPVFGRGVAFLGVKPTPARFAPPLGRAGQPVGPWGCRCHFCHGLSVRPRTSLLPPGPPAQTIAVSHVDSSLPHCELCRLVVVVVVVDIMEILVGRVLPWGPHQEHVLLLGGARMRELHSSTTTARQ